MTLKQIRMKLFSGYTGKAPQAPEDMDTFQPPAFFRLESCRVNVAVYDSTSTVATMTDVTELKMLISPTPDHASPVISEVANAGNSALDLTVTDADFLAGTARHGYFDIDASALAPHMGGQQSVTMYMRLSMTWDSKIIILAQGPVTVYEAGPLS